LISYLIRKANICLDFVGPSVILPVNVTELMYSESIKSSTLLEFPHQWLKIMYWSSKRWFNFYSSSK